MNALRKQVLEQEKKVKSNVDPKRFVKSSLFNETFVLRDVYRDMKSFWDDEEYGLMEFWTHFCEYADHFNSLDKENMNTEVTYEEIILPMLQVLGYGEIENDSLDHFVSLEIFKINTLDGIREIKPPLILVDKNSDKKYLLNNKNASDFINRFKEKAMLSLAFDYYDSLSDYTKGEWDKTKSFKSTDKDCTSHLELNQRSTEYLNIINSKQEFAIATDGARWRLIHKSKTKEDPSLMYEFDVSYFIGLFQGVDKVGNEDNQEFLNAVKWFYWFFSKKGLCDQGLGFVSTLESKSKKYASDIEEDMKMRFVHSVTISTNGYVKAFQARSKKELDLDLIVKTSESLVFNLFFLRSCESKGAIPFHQNYKRKSLANLINKLERFNIKAKWNENEVHIESLRSILEKRIKQDGYEIYGHIYFLFESTKNNVNGFGITGFVESIFNDDELDFFNKFKLTNERMIHLLHELMLHENDGKIRQIPYNSFSPRQLGSMYESFLEFKPFLVKKNMYYLRKKTKNKTTWQWIEISKIPGSVDHNSLYSVKKNEYIFSPDNKDRKSTGSYYTPHYVVEYIIRNALGPLTENLKSSSELLALNVCDPAMGSAHFLVEALKFLSSEYKRICQNHNKSDAEIKREVLDACIYGVDINVRAVKLAKMSLWLSSAYAGKKLEKLDDQVKQGDSLLGQDGVKNSFTWSKEFKHVFSHGGFDAIVGNPPYSSKHSSKYKKEAESSSLVEYKCDFFAFFIQKSMNLLNGKGRLGFIVPSSLLTNVYYEKMRRELVGKNWLDEIIYIKGRVFKDANVDCCILNLQANNHEKEFSFVKSDNELNKLDEIIIINEELIQNERCGISPNWDKEWDRDSRDIENVSIRLKELAKISLGLKLKSNDEYTRETKSNKYPDPIIFGKDIGRYEKIKPLKYFNFSTAIIIGGTKNPKVQKAETKIMIQAIRNLSLKRRIVATLDNNSTCFIGTSNSVVLHDDRYDYRYVLAILNSKLVNYYFSKKFSTISLTASFLGEIPVLELDLDEAKSEKSYNKILELVDKLMTSKSKDKIDLELEKLIHDLYGISDDLSKKIMSHLDKIENSLPEAA